MSLVIAVDIGGTHIRVAAYAPEQTPPVNHHGVPPEGLKPGVFDRLVQAVEAVWPADGDVAAIGMAVPGATRQRLMLRYQKSPLSGGT